MTLRINNKNYTIKLYILNEIKSLMILNETKGANIFTTVFIFNFFFSKNNFSTKKLNPIFIFAFEIYNY